MLYVFTSITIKQSTSVIIVWTQLGIAVATIYSWLTRLERSSCRLNTRYPTYTEQQMLNILWPNIQSRMKVAEAQELFDWHPDIDIHEKDITGWSWLSSAIAQNIELVKFLLKKTNAYRIEIHLRIRDT